MEPRLYGGRPAGLPFSAEASYKGNPFTRRVKCARLHPRIETQGSVNATYMYDMYLQDRRRGRTELKLYDISATDLGVRNMLRGELAFSSVQAVKMYGRQSKYRNPNMHPVPVWSHFNGLLEDEEVVFQGIVLKGYHGGVESQPLTGEHQHVTCQVSGTTTIFNTSEDTIAAGQIVYWDFPDQVNGEPTTYFSNDTPANKFVAKVCSSSMANRARAVYNAAKRVGAGGDPENNAEEVLQQFSGGAHLKAQKTALVKYFQSPKDETDAVELVLRLTDVVQAHRIGKALTTAAKGESFDILLGYGH